jgi:hypothetical protein
MSSEPPLSLISLTLPGGDSIRCPGVSTYRVPPKSHLERGLDESRKQYRDALIANNSSCAIQDAEWLD